ncbi:hypothetical protein AWB80_03113 [Caballeronia pedi]|uniref:Uncharacterized protein n=1 Tax=Caballeronia pedi TaxID=1777141 RepID=A0A158B701_9BURK|nr:hypothetical protein [Caballeronia pedi]SAK65875.1 hypothetical protein AWB80_03113 [Caballeronia pedi]
MTEERRAVIRDAISNITQSAESLRACHTSFDSRDDWGDDHEAKADYDAEVALVARLNALLSASIADTAGAKQEPVARVVYGVDVDGDAYARAEWLTNALENGTLLYLAATPASSVADAAGASERIKALFIENPADEMGPSDEPESQYRLGYNTALEDAIDAIAKEAKHG